MVLKKSANKSSPKKREGKSKATDAGAVHEEIAKIVRASAAQIAQALIDRAVHGDPAAAKYLFEFAEIFPAAVDTNAGNQEEDSLAKTLMHRLNLPEDPVKTDDEEDGKMEASERVNEGALESGSSRDQEAE